MKTAFLSLASLTAASALAAAPIDLNAPGALEQLQADQPQRYQIVAETLRVAEHLPCKDGELWAQLKVKYDIREMACYATILTSYPAKRRVTFNIEGDRYAAIVTLRDAGGRLVHAGELRESRPK